MLHWSCRWVGGTTVLFSEGCRFISHSGQSLLQSLCGLVSMIRASHMATGKCPLSLHLLMVFPPNITHSEQLYLVLSKDDNTRYLLPQARNRQYHKCTVYWKGKKSFFKMPRSDKSDTSSVAACTLILQQQLTTKDAKFVGTTNHEQCSDEIRKYILSWSTITWKKK